MKYIFSRWGMSLVATTMILTACGATTSTSSAESHGNGVEPNFEEVFSAGKIRRIDIKISKADWLAMWSDLDANMGGMMGGRGGMGGERPEGMMMGQPDSMGMGGRGGMMGGRGGERPEGMMMNGQPDSLGGGRMMGGRGGERPEGMMGGRGGEGAEGGRGGMMGGPAQTNDYTPLWVSCTVSYNGLKWEHVGVRFKGNSSLQRAYSSGTSKLSMKLDFDQYETEYPETKNQRFYGFKKLNLNNNMDDYSFMREKVVSDLMRDFGLAAAHTSFCEVYLTYDDTGAKFVGLYTIVEAVDDTVIETQFSDASGNLYKPESPAGTFAEGTLNIEILYLKTNKKTCDYSDVQALYEILNSDLRTSDEAKWRKELESVFNVDGFLKWLAASNAIQNWDSYGSMAHNYYLYNNPADGLLTWIPWDHNEALQQGKGRTTGDLNSLMQMGDSWPLITYLLAVDDYKSTFDNYLKEFVKKLFTPAKMSNIYDAHAAVLKDAAERELSGNNNDRFRISFDDSVEALKQHTEGRNSVVNNYLKR